MSLGIGHFAVGATGAIVVLVVTGWHSKTTQVGVIAIASGLWAMLPDIGLVLPGIGPTDHSPVANVFWFHYFLDTNAFTDSTTGSAVLVGLMVAAVGWLVLVEYGEESAE